MKKVLFLSLLVTSSLSACICSKKPYTIFVHTGSDAKQQLSINPDYYCVIIKNNTEKIVFNAQDTRKNVELAIQESLKASHNEDTQEKLAAALSAIQIAKKTPIIIMNGLVTTHHANLECIKKHKRQVQF